MSWIEEREPISIKEMVIRILDEFPEARSNDNILAVKLYGKYFDIRLIFELKRNNVPKINSIIRARQKIQAEGLYTKKRGSVDGQ